MLSLFKKLKHNYTQTFICILRLRASEYIFPIFDRYLLIPLQKKRYHVKKKCKYREYILVIKKEHLQKIAFVLYLNIKQKLSLLA